MGVSTVKELNTIRQATSIQQSWLVNNELPIDDEVQLHIIMPSANIEIKW